MKILIIGLLTMGLASSVLAQNRSQLNKRINLLNTKFTAMQENPDKRVPTNELAKARGIVLLNQTKAGFIFAYQGGNGVTMVRNTDTGNWSPAAFVSSSGASLGFQGGGEQDFFVILLMSTNATHALMQQKINFGAQASGTAGNQSAGTEANTESGAVRIYSQRNGLFGGVAFKGGTLMSDDNANTTYYGKSVSMEDILFKHKVQPTKAEENLVKKIQQYAK